MPELAKKSIMLRADASVDSLCWFCEKLADKIGFRNAFSVIQNKIFSIKNSPSHYWFFILSFEMKFEKFFFLVSLFTRKRKIALPTILLISLKSFLPKFVFCFLPFHKSMPNKRDDKCDFLSCVRMWYPCDFHQTRKEKKWKKLILSFIEP